MAHMKILIEMPSTTSHDETTLILILSFIFKLILKQKILSLYDEETDKDRGTDWISFFFLPSVSANAEQQPVGQASHSLISICER